MTSTSISLIYCPFPDLEAARLAARTLIEQKLVACCNLLPAGESHYVWEGEYTATSEIILIAKTMPKNLARTREVLERLHPYACPAILSFEASANAEFAAFVTASSR